MPRRTNDTSPVNLVVTRAPHCREPLGMRDIRYQAAIISGAKILILRCRRRHDGEEFLLLPGGGREVGESEEECVIREVREEVGIEIEVRNLIYEIDAIPPDGTYTKWRTYHCEVCYGIPTPGGGDSWAELTAVQWLELTEPDAWSVEIRTDAYLFPQLLRIREAVGSQALDPLVPALLAKALIAYSIHEHQLGHVTRIDVRFMATEVAVLDDGRGMGLDREGYVAGLVGTLLGGREAVQLHGIGLSLVAAAVPKLEVVSRRGATCWAQTFEHGVPSGPASLTSSETPGTSIRISQLRKISTRDVADVVAQIQVWREANPTLTIVVHQSS